MASSRLRNTILAGTIIMAAVAGTLALPRLVNNPTLLYVAGQVQIATGHTDDGFSLISRAAMSTPENDAPAAKPSPAKSAPVNCPDVHRKIVLKASNVVPRAQKTNLRTANVSEDFYLQNANEFPNAPMLVNFNLPAATLQKIDAKAINRRVQIMQERINRQVQKAIAAPRPPVAG